METDGGLGTMPFTFNRGGEVPASDEVKKTGLQPQVGAEEIDTPEKEETKKILQIDKKLKDVDDELPETESPKINKFKSLWNKLRSRWDAIKTDEPSPPPENGLGSTAGNWKMSRKMQQEPNSVPSGATQVPTGLQ